MTEPEEEYTIVAWFSGKAPEVVLVRIEPVFIAGNDPNERWHPADIHHPLEVPSYSWEDAVYKFGKEYGDPVILYRGSEVGRV